MMPAFTHPWLAWAALGAAAIPVVIHLLHRHKVVSTLFPPAFLLLSALEKKARRDRLKNLIILLSRIVLAASIFLAVSMPYLKARDDVVSVESKRPEAVAIVLDDSASMRTLSHGKTMFERAKQALKQRLSLLNDVDEAALVLASRPKSSSIGAFKPAANIMDELNDAEPGYSRVLLNPGLETAAAMLQQENKSRIKVLILVTDRAANALDLENPPWQGELRPDRVEVITLEDPDIIDNMAVVGAEVRKNGESGPAGFEVLARVSCFCRSPRKEVPVRLLVDGRVEATSFVDLDPGGMAQARFTVNLDSPGFHSGEVRVDSHDPFEDDDSMPVVLQAGKRARLLVVDGAPSSIPFLDEVFYLERALDPTRGGNQKLSIKVIDPEDLAGQDMSAYDVLFLCNMPAETLALALEQVEGFLEEGNGVFLSVGDKVVPKDYARLLAGILPGEPVAVSGTGSPQSGLGIRAKFPGGPILGPVESEAGESLAKARVWKWLSMKPGRDTRTVLTLSNGAPLLIIAYKGRGRVLFLTTSIDRNWTDFPISPVYLPVLQRSAYFLAKDLVWGGKNQVEVGQKRKIKVIGRPGKVEVSVKGPSGRVFKLGKPAGPGNARFVFSEIKRPGIFHVMVNNDVVDAFAAVMNPAESDLTRLPAPALEKFLTSKTGRYVEVPESGAGKDKPLWAWFLLIAVMAALLESLLRAGPIKASWRARSRIRQARWTRGASPR
ncbi:MAG: VWA domain-containing protein [Deltaproteobacteria bacterium]|nr:VWA domain-containing protein [Deltaproteobacteria bacterium]